MNALKAYSWPGNIRELENIVEHAFIIENTDEIHLQSLPNAIQTCSDNNPPDQASKTSTEAPTTSPQEVDQPNGIVTDFSELKYPVLRERFEKEFILRALKAFNGRINQTAEHTQMTKVTLLRKLEKYSINPKEFRRP